MTQRSTFRQLGLAAVFLASTAASGCASGGRIEADQESFWRLEAQGRELTFVRQGDPELTLACPVEGTMRISYAGPVYAGPAQPTLTLTSGRESVVLQAEVDSIRRGDRELVSITAQTNARAGVLEQFGRTGQLTVQKFGPAKALNASDELPVVRAFLRQCRS